MRHRPLVLVDIQSARARAFSRLPRRVWLLTRAKRAFFALNLIKACGVLGILLYAFLGSVIAPVYYRETLAAENANAQDRAALEAQLTTLESQITQYESTVTSYKKQGKSLQSEIDRLNSRVKKLNLQIKAIELSLANLDGEIADNKLQVVTTESKLDFSKRALADAIQNIYESENKGLLEILINHPRLSQFAADVNGLMALQDNLRVVVRRVADLRLELLDAQEQLSMKRADENSLKAYQASQKTAIQSVQKEKSQLLAATKGQESKYQELLQLTKKTAAQIRSQIFEFLGGGELTFEDAYKFAKVAESATGVRAAFVLAVMDKESALGQNVGRCSYKTAMNPKRDTPIFLALTSALAINPDTITVSCANRDGAYGGAMGPAQFIPSTWKLYAARIGEITGNNPPSPWRNGDAFVAAALHLKDAGARAGATISEERRAAARYYAGSRWQRFLWSYGEHVVSRAQQFQQDIDVLNG